MHVDTVNVDKINVPQQPDSAGKSSKDSEKPPSYFSRLIAPETLPNTLLCLVGFGGIVAAYYTLRAMNQQAGLMERQIVLMERQINKDRARIRIELEDFTPQYPEGREDSAIQHIGFKVSVYGSTYAFIDEQGFEAELMDSPNEALYCGGNIAEVPKVVSPEISPIKLDEVLILTRFEIDSVLHGKAFIHFRGLIKYHDFSDIPRETVIWEVWKSMGPRKGMSVLGGNGFWRKGDGPEANRET
jgi:hypothetical protein